MINAVTASKLTINLVAANTTFANAFYGVDSSGKPIPVLASGPGVKAINVTVLSGKNPLDLNLVSPVSFDEATLYNGAVKPANLIAIVDLVNGKASFSPVINGTPALANAPAPPAK